MEPTARERVAGLTRSVESDAPEGLVPACDAAGEEEALTLAGFDPPPQAENKSMQEISNRENRMRRILRRETFISRPLDQVGQLIVVVNCGAGSA